MVRFDFRGDDARQLSVLYQVTSLGATCPIPGGLATLPPCYVRSPVDGARPSDTAIEWIERPATKPREIPSRSANVSAYSERRRGAGRIPPVSARTRWVDE